MHRPRGEAGGSGLLRHDWSSSTCPEPSDDPREHFQLQHQLTLQKPHQTRGSVRGAASSQRAACTSHAALPRLAPSSFRQLQAVFALSKDGCLQHMSLSVRASVTARQGPNEPVNLTPEGKVKVFVAQSCLALCDPMGCTRQAPLSMGFSRQEYWCG